MADTELDVRERAPALAAEPSQPTQRVDRVTVIKPAPRWPHLDLRELWQYRELLGATGLARHRGSLQADVDRRRLGDSPALPDDGRLHVRLRDASRTSPRTACRTRSSPTPHCCPGRTSRRRSRSRARSLVSNRGLVTKVYFPRILLPLAGVTVPIVDFLLASVVLVAMMAWYDVWPSLAIVFAPVFLADGLRRRARSRALPLGRQRPLSRRSLRDSLPAPDLALSLGCRVRDRRASASVGSGCSLSIR